MALHPVGPLPASTYWRRRLVLLAVLVALVLLVRSCAGGADAPARTAGRPSPSPSSSATPTPTASPRPTVAAGPVTCRDSDLRLTTASDAPSYAAGSTAVFTITVTNASPRSCRRELGGGALEVLVHSGDDRIWSSDDCSPDKGRFVQTLKPGGSLQTTVSWRGKRSARGCPADRPEAKPGTYTVRARLATLRSTVTVFRLTG